MGKPITITLNSLWAAVIAVAPIISVMIFSYGSWKSDGAVQAQTVVQVVKDVGDIGKRTESVERALSDKAVRDARVEEKLDWLLDEWKAAKRQREGFK